MVAPMQAQAKLCNGQGYASTSAAVAIVWAMLWADERLGRLLLGAFQLARVDKRNPHTDRAAGPCDKFAAFAQDHAGFNCGAPRSIRAHFLPSGIWRFAYS